MSNIAFIGLGAMGVRMAGRLLDASHSVSVYNRTPERAEALVARGARLAQTPRDAVRGAEIVIGMLTDDAVSRSVWTDPESGVLGGLSEGVVAIESSTLTPAWTRELGELVAEAGADYLDAPVVGTLPHADAGALVHLVGGDRAVLERVRGPLGAMGNAIHHVGPVGAGASMKLAVNALFGIQVAALAETVGVLERSGFERGAALEVLGAMAITSPALKAMGGLIAARRYAPMFPIGLVEKDFRYAVDNAKGVGVSAPVTDAARGVYAEAIDRGFGGDNIVGVSKLYET